MAVPENNKHKDCVRYAEHCLKMVPHAPDQEYVNPQSQNQIRYLSGRRRTAHVPATAEAAPMPSATAMRKRFDSQSAGESGRLS
jgi:hypothetical protein